MSHPYALAIHGGAGVMPRDLMSADREAAYEVALDHCLACGERLLAAGGSALDAAAATVCALEDDPLFNAGRGAVFTRDGRHEMDAAIMDGRDLRAGAVAGICGPKNPVMLARLVMERTSHVFLIGEGAMALARECGISLEDEAYFFTRERRQSLDEMLKLEAEGRTSADPAMRHGTVGAVARDRQGNLAAATSTGGMTGKMAGRVGDTPVIGAGTLADNRSCAISATGDGEAFLRLAVAREIDARLRLADMSLAEAARDVIMSDLAALGGEGGLVAIDAQGTIAMPFNSPGMYRAWTSEGADRGTAIYENHPKPDRA